MYDAAPGDTSNFGPEKEEEYVLEQICLKISKKSVLQFLTEAKHIKPFLFLLHLKTCGSLSLPQ